MQAAGKNQPLFVLRRQAAAELVRADLRFAVENRGCCEVSMGL